jgi:hydroxyacylglutathione hydrolase
MINISAIPALDSNYIWVIEDDKYPDQCYLVDPGEAAPSLSYLAQYQLRLMGILVTHRHHDHIGGIDEILHSHPCPVIGPASEQIPQVTQTVTEASRFKLFDSDVEVLEVPGHTPEHIAFVLSGNHPPVCFSGDALFAGGCGNRMLSAEVMFASIKKFKNLSPDTLLYCGHEYTFNNLRFALTIEPSNNALVERYQRVKVIHEEGGNSLPSCMHEEFETNPFLRTEYIPLGENMADVASGLGKPRNESQIFAYLRETKDKFR